MAEQSGSEHAERLKERVYVTFTALAVVLALREHEASADAAAVTLSISLAGTLLAVFVADVISHVAVYAVLPSRMELRRMVWSGSRTACESDRRPAASAVASVPACRRLSCPRGRNRAGDQ